MGKKIRIRIGISESLETIYWVRILKFFDADPGSKKLGSGIKINIPDPQHWISSLHFLGFYFIKLVPVPRKSDTAPQCDNLNTSPNKSSPNQPLRNQADLAQATSPTPIHIRNRDPVLWIRISSDPKLFARSSFGSGKIIPDPDPDGPDPEWIWRKKNFYFIKLQFLNKMHNFKNIFFQRKKLIDWFTKKIYAGFRSRSETPFKIGSRSVTLVPSRYLTWSTPA